MGNVTYYPAQKLTVAGTEINLVQSADVDFSISRQDVFEFGNLYAIDNIQVEPPTATLNFSYILATGINNHTALGLNAFDTLLADVAGKQYILSGAGALTIPSGLITSYAVEASVGNVPTVSVSVQALDATYAAGNPTYPAVGTNSDINVVRPDDITVTLGGTVFECRSFSYTLDIPREYVNKLGLLTSIANIISGPPKVTVEAEIILRDSANPKFGNNTKTAVSINCGGLIYTISDAKIANFTSNTSLDDIQVASITLEAPVKSASAIGIPG
jgi:hypothetical protein